MSVTFDRDPAFLVDKLLPSQNDRQLVAIKNVSIMEPCFQQATNVLFIYPPGEMVRLIIHASRLLLQRNAELFERTAKLHRILTCEFVKDVVPGDQLRIETEITKIKDEQVCVETRTLVEGKTVATVNLEFEMVQAPKRASIHPTATVHPTAILGKDVSIGPYTTVGEHVIIGDRTILEAHVMIEKWTKIGDDCHIFFGAVLGSAPQDVKHTGEKSWVEIGDRNQIREYVTINRATGKDAVTQIGSDNLFLTNVHIGHNCQIGNNVIIANMCHLGGHTVIDDKATIGGITGIHQYTRIGEGAMVGACSRLGQDVPPFTICEGNPALVHGLNTVGLKRRGINRENFSAIKQAFKLVFRSKLKLSQAITEIEALPVQTDEVQKFLRFVKADSDRGLAKKTAAEEPDSEE